MSGTMTTKRETMPRRWFDTTPLATLRHEMDELFGSFFGAPAMMMGEMEVMPKLDVAETANAIEVKTDLPGVKPENVEVEVRENLLTIRGHMEEEKEEAGSDKKFHRVERRSGTFTRSVWLPTMVDEGKVDAELKNGVLSITLPKAESVKPHKVAIKA